MWRGMRPHLPAFLDRGRRARAILERAEQLAAQRPVPESIGLRRAQGGPMISLVAPVYNTPPAYLDDLLASFRAQNIPGRAEGLFELVLSDDGSTDSATKGWLDRAAGEPLLRILRNPANAGIAGATNAGIEAATGEWVALIDHDDAIAPYALEQIAIALLERPETEFLYTDEVITDGWLNPEGYFLKPAWDEVLLSGVNYINHFSVYRRSRLLAIAKLRLGFDGSQDYDLLLRYTRDLSPEQIRHLPYPAYLWRRNGESYSVQFMDKATTRARQALQERFGRPENPVEVLPALDPNLHRLNFARARENWPRVSVVIPSRNARALITQVMSGLLENTDYPEMEIIIVDNGTDDPEVLALYETWRQGPRPFRAEIRPEPFNFSRAVNRGCALATGEAILLLNNDIEIREPDWLKEMVSCFDYPRTGIVGAKLLYPDRTIQHAGVIAGLGGLAGHWFIGEKRDFPGPMGRLHVRQSLSVVTGACYLISRSCWEAVGPFDEEKFAIAYNDVDFCLRAVEQGIRVVWTPFAELIHHESASRGSDETPQNIERFRREQDNLRERHRTDVLVDRAFNPWWTRGYSRPDFQAIEGLPPPR
jgi:GT2 family glycosyltransferase